MKATKMYSASLIEAIGSFWRNRWLIMQMAKREVVGRYRGSFLGLAWSFFNPILMLVIYTFVFSVVFKTRWGIGESESNTDFALILFIGMIIHGLFSECINASPSLVVSNANYVKKVVFPLDILPWISMGGTLFHSSISFVVWILFLLLLGHQVSWTIIFFPLVIFPLILLTVGISWILSAIGVFIHDVRQITGVITTALMFLAPIFYPLSALPEKYRGWLYLNPLTYVIEESRNVLIWHRVPDWEVWGIYAAVSMAVFAGGFWLFQRARTGFADVM